MRGGGIDGREGEAELEGVGFLRELAGGAGGEGAAAGEGVRVGAEVAREGERGGCGGREGVDVSCARNAMDKSMMSKVSRLEWYVMELGGCEVR